MKMNEEIFEILNLKSDTIEVQTKHIALQDEIIKVQSEAIKAQSDAITKLERENAYLQRVNEDLSFGESEIVETARAGFVQSELEKAEVIFATAIFGDVKYPN